MGVGEWWMVSVGVILAVWVAGSGVKGHGRLMEPVGRSSAWRKGYDTPVNYNDNELFCGGFDVRTKKIYIDLSIYLFTFLFIYLPIDLSIIY